MVSQGMKIPDASFIAGVPAKVKGRVNPSQAARVEEGVKAYIRLALEYKQHEL